MKAKVKIEAMYYHFQSEDTKDITKASKVRITTGADKHIDIYIGKETGVIEIKGTDIICVSPQASNSITVELVKRR